MSKRISIIIPAYNEEENIKLTIDELLVSLNTITDISDIQIFVVDDASTDSTFDVVEAMADKRINCLRLSRRSGSHVAVRAGMAEVSGDVVLCISADGQDNTSCLPAMMEKWKNGSKIVWALRKDRKNETWYYRLFVNIFYKTLHWVGGDKSSSIDMSRADFFLLDKVIADAINRYTEKNIHLFGLISWLGFKQDFVEYDRCERRYGKPKWNFSGRLYMAKEWIISYSGLPLKIMTVMGFIIASLGFAYAIYIIFLYMFSPMPVRGWPSLIVAIFILGGMQMCMLGVIGEYLWRNLEESRKRPLYFLEKRTDIKK